MQPPNRFCLLASSSVQKRFSHATKALWRSTHLWLPCAALQQTGLEEGEYPATRSVGAVLLHFFANVQTRYLDFCCVVAVQNKLGI